MKQNKIIWISFVLTLVGLILYFATPKNTNAKGGKEYGGVLRISSKSKKLNFFPLANNTLEQQRIQQLIFEPLLKPAQNERGWRYCLASKITLNAKKNRVTIHLKKNIHFTDNPCFRFHTSELTAKDVAFSLSLACAQQHNTQQELLLPKLIVGGEYFYQKKLNPAKTLVSGIHIIDTYTLQIELTNAYNHFLNLLTSPSLGILSKQAAKYYDNQIANHPVGTGPFMHENKKGQQFIFERNNAYWRHDKYGNQLPYLDRIELTCGMQGQLAHKLFLNNKLDLLFDLPIDELREAFGTLHDAKLGKNPLHEVYIKNAAKVHFIQFNSSKGPFQNVAVRKAFALVIDTKTICNEVLKGEGQALNGQFIPTQKHYKNNLLLSDTRDLAQKITQAKLLLMQAGYNAQHPLPPIVFYVGAAKNTLTYKWAAAAAQMLKDALHIRVILKEENVSKQQSAKNKGVMWRSVWVGDYPGAESYLRLFYSGTQNPITFDHHAIDGFYLGSVRATSRQSCRRLQMRCEKAILEQQALIPIYTEDFIVLNQLRLRGLQLETSGMLDFAELFMKEVK